MSKTVFIIHGRDLAARDALSRFLKALRLQVLDFQTIADQLGPSPFIADVVFRGIEIADAVIALFTPDEHAALYENSDADGTMSGPIEHRWQARPNVIFEAGVALGTRPNQTILATLGSDVALFSDVNGKHFVRLDDPDGKSQLWNRLKHILFTDGSPETKRGASMAAKSLAALVRKRWDYHDEVYLLANRMRHHLVGKRATPPSLLDIVAAVVQEKPRLDPWKIHPRHFMDRVQRHFPKLANKTYWWLIIFGFFRFLDDEDWGITAEEDWQSSAPCAELAERGVALIRRLQVSAE